MSSSYPNTSSQRTSMSSSTSSSSSPPAYQSLRDEYRSQEFADPVTAYTMFMREYTRRQMDSALRSDGSSNTPDKAETGYASKAGIKA